MARHEITIPVNKSSNSSYRIPIRSSEGGDITPPYTSNALYLSNTLPGADTRVVPINLGVAWDKSLIPLNKLVISTKVYLYSKYSFSRALVYKKGEFSEGLNIPQIDVSDGTLSSLLSGWNILNYNGDLEGYVIVGVAAPVSPSDYETHAELYSHRASNYKPYVVVTYDDIPPSNPSSLYPSNITLNPRDIIRFSWLHNSNEGLQQKAFSLQYSTNGGTSWTTVSQTTPNQYYDMPANTLPISGSIMWRVQTTDGNNDVTGYTTVTFTVGTPPQKAPISIKPIGEYLDSTKPIQFEWNFTGGTPGETQSKFDLQYSINSGSTWITKTVSTSNKFHELPENTFNTGNVIWRVRTYNNWGEVSPYSDNRSFTVIGSPPIPQIVSVSNSARPLITWTSIEQQIYELQVSKDNIMIIDIGNIPSISDRNYKPLEYLQNGDYKVKLRVMNEYNLYSPWAEKSFVISTVKPSKPIMSVYSGEYGVTIKTSDATLETLVYRDKAYIGKVIGNHFVDFTGENNKEYQYFTRVIDIDDNFNDSDIKLAKCRFSGNTIALLDDPGKLIKLDYGLDGIPKKSNSFSVIGSLIYFDGRKNPVAEFSEFEDESKTLVFFVKTQDEVDALKDLIRKRKVLLYRDYKGKNIIGTVLSIQGDNDILGYIIGFTITRCSV